MDLNHRRIALARGHTDADLQRACRSGGAHRVRPGMYVDADEYAELTAIEQYRLRVQAAGLAHTFGAVVSHESAAVMHDLELWNANLRLIHITRTPPGSGRLTAKRHLHRAPLADDDVTDLDGILTTSAVRTVADLCRSLPFEEAVVVGDSAMRTLGIDRAALDATLDRMPGWPGAPAARRAVAFLDGRSESVGESRSRVMLDRFGFMPELQREVFSADGLLLGRVDFCLPHVGVIGEFDGRVKYGRLLRPGQSAGDAVFEEKRREDALRDAGWEVVRWIWSELAEPTAILRRFERAIARGRRVG